MLARGALDVFDDLLAGAFACSSCLSHVPLLSGYDDPTTLSYQIPLFGPISADVRQPEQTAISSAKQAIAPKSRRTHLEMSASGTLHRSTGTFGKGPLWGICCHGGYSPKVVICVNQHPRPRAHVTDICVDCPECRKGLAKTAIALLWSPQITPTAA